MSPRLVVRRIHLILGLVVGILLAVVAASGAAASFRPEIERLYAAPCADRPRQADPDATVAAILARYPGAVVSQLEAGRPDAWRIRSGPARDAETWAVFTDPSDGAWLGDTRGQWLAGTVAWIARFHHDLWLRPVGGILVGSAGLAFLGFAATGLWLWWPGLARLGGALCLRWSAGGIMRQHDLHRLIGVAFLPILAVIAITGAMFEFTWLRRGVHAALGGTAADAPPALRPREAQPRSAPTTAPIGWSTAIAAATAATPGAPLLQASPPRTGDATGTWRVVLDRRWNASRRSGLVVQVDRGSGAVLEIQDPAAMSAGGWVLNQHWGLHLGWFGGSATRLLWALAGLMPALLLGSGLILWHHRRHHRPESA